MSSHVPSFKFDSKKFAKMLAHDILSKRDRVQKIYNHRSLEVALEQGKVIGPLKLSADANGLAVFHTNAYYTRFRAGDVVTLSHFNGSELIPLDDGFTIASVRFIKVGVIEIRLAGERLSASPGEYFLSESANEDMAWNLKARILQAEESINKIVRRKLPIKNTDIFSRSDLNELQLKSIENILNYNFNGAIQGPPGTGKTQTLCALLEVAIANGLKVGLCAYTHTAVDNALLRINSKYPNINSVRIGDENKIDPKLIKSGVKVSDSFSSSVFEEKISGQTWQLISATSHAWAFSKMLPWVDILLIDEAAQIPAYMLPCLSLRGNSLVFLGDHKQLPPIVQTSSSNKSVDIFSEVLNQLGNRVVMLEEQYRMNERLQEWANQSYYYGKLRAGEKNKNRDVLKNSKYFHDSDKVSLISYSGYDHERRQAEIVLQEISKASLSGLDFAEIGIIAPHRNQASAINQKLQESYGVEISEKLSADTVERYQGQEREYVILGFSTFRDFATFESSTFVSNPNRLNVASTRAKSRLTVISNMNQETYGVHTHAHKFLKWAGSKTKRHIEGKHVASKAS